MLGTKIYKTDMSNYTDCAIWCNANNATIEDKGDYYEVVPLPLPTLEEIKATKIAELKAQRDSKEVEPITYNGNRYDYDDKARDRINVAIAALGDTGSLSWTTADNKEVTVTGVDLRSVLSEAAKRSISLHKAYRAAREKVLNATTKEEVEQVVLNG